MNPTTPTTPDGASAASASESPRRRLSRGRGIALGTALIVLLAGLSAAGYVGWQYYGTDIIARSRQAELRADLRATWTYPTVEDVLGPAASSPPLGAPSALVLIPSLGSDYAVPLIEGVRDQDLARGIGHFPGTGPGQIGNFALTGHQVSNGEAFGDLLDLRPGDEVIIQTPDATYTYVLDTDPNDLQVPLTDNWVIDPVPVPPDGEGPPGVPKLEIDHPMIALITLTTCSEIFHTDDRTVAFGHLVKTEPR